MRSARGNAADSHPKMEFPSGRRARLGSGDGKGSWWKKRLARLEPKEGWRGVIKGKSGACQMCLMRTWKSELEVSSLEPKSNEKWPAGELHVEGVKEPHSAWTSHADLQMQVVVTADLHSKALEPELSFTIKEPDLNMKYP